jgi:hypothetical protein
VQRGAGGICLRVEELEPQRCGEILEQGKPLSQRDGLQDEAVLIDEAESAERLGERGAARQTRFLPATGDMRRREVGPRFGVRASLIRRMRAIRGRYSAAES